MADHGSHMAFLRGLAPADFDRELRQELKDSLQELVAVIERDLPLGGNTLHGCVIDDFQVQKTEPADRECRVRLRFSASARQGVDAAVSLEQIVGTAEAVIDDAGRVRYREVRFAEDPAFVPHDVGGGD